MHYEIMDHETLMQGLEIIDAKNTEIIELQRKYNFSINGINVNSLSCFTNTNILALLLMLIYLYLILKYKIYTMKPFERAIHFKKPYIISNKAQQGNYL